MSYNFNKLEESALRLSNEGRYADALKIYLYMADGDNSMDGGYLGKKIGDCYRSMGDLHSARFWYGRAIEENPEVNSKYAEIRENLGDTSIDDLLA